MCSLIGGGRPICRGGRQSLLVLRVRVRLKINSRVLGGGETLATSLRALVEGNDSSLKNQNAAMT